MAKFLNKIGLEPFVLALFGAIFLAWLNPSIGSSDKAFSVGDAANWGVSLIFFFYGLRLSRDKLANGLRNTKLHLLVHASTFLLFPIIALALMGACGGFSCGGSAYYLWIGVFFLATLPSTVSSSVVMVSIAGGNLPAAIFNASVSSLIGVFITPLWMGIFLDNIEGSRGLGEVLAMLVFQVLVPVCLGFVLNPKFGVFAERNRKILRKFDETVIVMIVYSSFCDSFAAKMFEGVGAAVVLGLSAGMAALFLAAMLAIYCACSLMKFPRADTITAVFCGSKKSLVHGSVMSGVLFGPGAPVGVILLPTMLYHALQLVIVSVIARKLGAGEAKK